VDVYKKTLLATGLGAGAGKLGEVAAAKFRFLAPGATAASVAKTIRTEILNGNRISATVVEAGLTVKIFRMLVFMLDPWSCAVSIKERSFLREIGWRLKT